MEAYDVAVLFLAYTKNFVKRFVNEGAFYTEHPKVHVEFQFQKKGIKIKVDNSTYNVRAKDTIYNDWISLVIELHY